MVKVIKKAKDKLNDVEKTAHELKGRVHQKTKDIKKD